MNKNEKDQKVRTALIRVFPQFNTELLFQKIVQIANWCVKLENGLDPTVPAKSFTFDSVYDDNAPTEAIYNDICYPLVEVSSSNSLT